MKSRKLNAYLVTSLIECVGRLRGSLSSMLSRSSGSGRSIGPLGSRLGSCRLRNLVGGDISASGRLRQGCSRRGRG